ncbi:hypothetical protein B5F44_04945 [Gordonibacter urolithinfaciens]|uniref:hypothetical protein n=1 Tax=Gordonibacter urolithinfaciens TaxID=1335613 RepID=UPI000B39F51E|nr:hypothetical protein [Gordonibacter urolithinfaciens]OUO87809.1 hypothetical protein B5F44_04945 [Gordonibacter urolithinfaciens]
MNAKKKATDTTKPATSTVSNRPRAALSALLVQAAHVEARRPAPSGSRRLDPLARIFDANASRAAKIAAVSRLADPVPLVTLAASDAPAYLRRNALLRLDELMDGRPLARTDLERLVPCLRDKELIAFAVVLMDIADFDWCARCDEVTVDALCLALHECQGLHETVLLEDTFAHLVHTRPDLGRNLRACSPGPLHLKAMYQPVVAHNVVYVDLAREDNVA